jgi:signal recognition particle receptor subunit beta
MALHLYGTPGQTRFDFMWDILINKAHAYIVLIAAHRPREFRQARNIINFMQARVSVPMIIGISHTDCPGAWAEEDIYLAIGYVDEQNRPPLVKVNPNERDSVAEAVIHLVQYLMESCAVES